MNRSFEYVSVLEYRLKAANDRIKAFESGERYTQQQAKHHQILRAQELQIKKLVAELTQAHRDIITIRNQWFEVFEDFQKTSDKKEATFIKEIQLLHEKLIKAEGQRDAALDKVTELRKELYEVKIELEDEKGKNIKLIAQINRDYENSSLSSSKSIKNKKIINSREKTGRKPGGQPGHNGHCRKKQVPTSAPILLPPPQEVLEDPDFKKTSKTIIKQHISLRVELDVVEYHADVYYNSKTGERIHAEFPAGIINDVNYDGSIKAFLFLLNNDCCTSIDKSRTFLSELTGGKLNISKGMINKLSKEFALKSKAERKELMADMMLSPVMHTDCTNAKVNGQSAQIFVCATTDGKAMYYAREKKGHEGVKGTLVEEYQGILVHDHDKTFYQYGSDHQECLAHILRYLKASIENEAERKWNKKMFTLLQEMIHYRNHLPTDEFPDIAKISEYEERYKEVIEAAKEEYEDIPPNDYYRDGYNLYLRLDKYMSNHLLFLRDHRVPTTNNEAERLLRKYKRKQQQAMSFRSHDSIEALSECMSMLVWMRQREEKNVFDTISQTFR